MSPAFKALPRTDAEAYGPEEGEACISITDPGHPDARLSKSFVAVLRVQFDDITLREAHQGVLFDERHADEILGFVAAHPNITRWVVHCNAGFSRSPAVAIALTRIFGGDARYLEATHPGYNRFVHRVLLARARRNTANRYRGTSAWDRLQLWLQRILGKTTKSPSTIERA